MTKGTPYRKDKNKMCDPKLCSKSAVDHKRCESEENPDLLRALKYLKERGYEESEDDEPSPIFSPSPKPQARPYNRQRVEQYERGKAEVTEGKTEICFNFEKKGAGLIRGCKYIHMDRNASYPNYSKDLNIKEATLRKSTINLIEVMEMIIELNLNLKEYAIILLILDNVGLVIDANTDINRSSSLEFDVRARNSFNSSNYYTSGPTSMHSFKDANFDRNFTRVDDFKERFNFLGELKDIVKSLKGIVESHHVTQSQHPAVVYPNPQVLPVVNQTQPTWPVTGQY